MKLLFITNIAKKIGSFTRASIQAAHSLGWSFVFVGNLGSLSPESIKEMEKENDITIYNVPINRSPFSFSNIKAYTIIKKIIQEEKIDIIHCNTPVGGLLGRLAGQKCKVKKIIYQAHGFHFYKGAPIINWLIYYPIEKWLARKTDVLITINNEDFDLAKKRMHLRKSGRIYYVPGVGMDLSAYVHDEAIRETKRAELGLSATNICLISMGDLIERKNYITSIKSIAEANNDNIKYFICGEGPEKDKLLAMVNDLGLKEQVVFLGYRSDIKELLNAADIFLFTSKQEGLARSLMEAMAAGIPCIASNIRGNTDLIGNNGGFLCDINNEKEYAEKINTLANNKTLRDEMGNNNLLKVRIYNIDNIINLIQKIYDETIKQ